jgi:hypothetical protein
MSIRSSSRSSSSARESRGLRARPRRPRRRRRLGRYALRAGDDACERRPARTRVLEVGVGEERRAAAPADDERGRRGWSRRRWCGCGGGGRLLLPLLSSCPPPDAREKDGVLGRTVAPCRRREVRGAPQLLGHFPRGLGALVTGAEGRRGVEGLGQRRGEAHPDFLLGLWRSGSVRRRRRGWWRRRRCLRCPCDASSSAAQARRQLPVPGTEHVGEAVHQQGRVRRLEAAREESDLCGKLCFFFPEERRLGFFQERKKKSERVDGAAAFP